MIEHAVTAVKTSAQGEQALNGDSITVAIVGRDEPFSFLAKEEIEAVLARLNQDMEVEA